MTISKKFGKAFVSEFMRELGKRGARMRMKKLTPEQRSEIARKAGSAPKKARRK